MFLLFLSCDLMYNINKLFINKGDIHRNPPDLACFIVLVG